METVSYTPLYYHPSIRHQTTPYLSTSEYEILQQIKFQFPKSSIDGLYTKILHSIPRMKNFYPRKLRKCIKTSEMSLCLTIGVSNFLNQQKGLLN